MRKLILAGGALLAAASVTALLAQTVDGLDLEAVRKRSAEMQDEAVAFVEQVKDRGDAFREDAASVRVGGMQNLERVATADLPTGPAGPMDFDEIVAGVATNIDRNTVVTGQRVPGRVALGGPRPTTRNQTHMHQRST